MGKRIKLRAAWAVGDEGGWNVVGWNAGDESLRHEADDCFEATLVRGFVTFEVEIPDPPQAENVEVERSSSCPS